MNSVEDVLDRMRQAYQVDDLTALANCLVVDEKTFRVWRTRQAVPDRVLVKASTETGRAVQWLKEGAASQAYKVQETTPKKFEQKEKQINVTPEELALLQNYRAASEEGRRMLSAAGAAVAKPRVNKEKAA